MMTCWPLAKLGDHIDLLAGFAFKSHDFTEDADDVRLLRGANIGQGSLRWDQAKRWPRSRIADHKKFELAVDDIVLAMDRPWIEAGLKWSAVRKTDLPALLVQRVARLRATGPLSQDFLRYLVGSPQFEAYIRPIVTGVNVPHISPSQIRDFSFYLPPRQSQDAIADLLRPVDDLIESNRRRIEILEEMARLLYREWFVDFRFPGHEDVELVDSDLGPIPDGWVWRNLFDLAEIGFGFSFKSRRFAECGNFRVIRIRDVPKNTTSTYTDEDGGERYEVHDGDTLIGMDGDFHMCRWADGLAYLNQRVARLRTRGQLSQLHLHLALEQPIRRFNETIIGTTVAHLGKRHLEEIHIAEPPSRLLVAATKHFGPVFELELNLRKQNRALREARDLLLPRLVSGELDVSELDLGLEALGA